MTHDHAAARPTASPPPDTRAETQAGDHADAGRRRRPMFLRRRRRRRSVPELMERQVALALEGVTVARQVCEEADPARSRSLMTTIEHAGDDARARLIDRMASTLTTHLDREDIFRASRSVDDVLDNLRDFVRENDLWLVPHTPHAVTALDHVEESLRALGRGVVERGAAAASGHYLDARKAANAVRRTYQEGLAELFAGPLTMDVLRRREALRRLDIVALRLLEATDALLDGMVKRTL